MGTQEFQHGFRGNFALRQRTGNVFLGTSAGNISGVITLNYEDASGNPRTISKDFTATAEEMNYDDYMPDPDSNVDEPQQTGMPVWGWVLIVVCVGVVVAVIVVVVLRKRKKAKALAALDEDSDEDI